MFLKTQLANDKSSVLLLNALSDYQIDLERGNYDTLDAYSHEWNALEVWSAISDSVNKASKNLLLSTQEVADFTSQIKKEPLIHLGPIAQFITLIHFSKTKTQIKPENELNYLNKNSKIELYIEAGMPGFSLIYLDAVMHSLLSTQSKLSTLSQIIISLAKNKGQFGLLSDLIIQILVQQWLRLFEQLEPEYKMNFMVSKDEHQQRVSHCLSIEEAQKKLTLIEQYTLKILDKLNNGIKNDYH